MRNSKLLLLFFSFFFSVSSFAVTTPEPAKARMTKFAEIKPHDLERMLGRKLSLFEKFKLKVARKIIRKKMEKGQLTPQQEKWATASLALGIGSLVLLLLSSLAFMGILGLLCIPAAILALIYGVKSLKGNSNTKGIVGVVTGGLTLGIIVLAIVIVLVFFSGFAFE